MTKSHTAPTETLAARLLWWIAPYALFAAIALTFGLWAAWWCAVGALGMGVFAMWEIGGRIIADRERAALEAIGKTA